MTLSIWTDGGCHNNSRTRMGGWAFVVEREGDVIARRYGWALDTTSNRMEMTAVLRALLWFKDVGAGFEDAPLAVHSDSQYVVRGLIDWLPRWRRQGWMTASGGQVANEDLWRAILEAKEGLTCRWVWVRGHAGARFNEEADAMCTRAMRRARWRSARARGVV